MEAVLKRKSRTSTPLRGGSFSIGQQGKTADLASDSGSRHDSISSQDASSRILSTTEFLKLKLRRSGSEAIYTGDDTFVKRMIETGPITSQSTVVRDIISDG